MKFSLSLYLGAAFLALTVNMTHADGHLIFKPNADSKFNWSSYDALKKVDLKGETITVFGPWIGIDKKLAENVFAYFETATGADIKYSGSDSFEQQIVIDTEAGTAPNVAVFPQPGLAADLASKGHLTPLEQGTADWVRNNYAAGQSWVDLGSYKGKNGKKDLYGLFYKIDVKSLVWYSPENFEDAGYEIPQTMEELKALSDKIVADGGTPWCVGLGSGGATGWVATDWVEDFMLRTQPPEVYDDWVTNKIKFNDQRVIAAIEDYGSIVRNDAYVAGGAGAVATTTFQDSPKGLFSSPPKCYMHRQASFIPAFFPKDIKVGADANFFYFPAYASKNLGKPVLGGGTLFAITKESKGAHEFIKFLQSPIAHEIFMAQQSFLTPHKGVNVDAYANDSLKGMGKILLGATTFRFDASDLMPGAIGAGAFWTGMVDYSGGKGAKEVTNDIQKTWDSIK